MKDTHKCLPLSSKKSLKECQMAIKIKQQDLPLYNCGCIKYLSNKTDFPIQIKVKELPALAQSKIMVAKNHLRERSSHLNPILEINKFIHSRQIPKQLDQKSIPDFPVCFGKLADVTQPDALACKVSLKENL